MAVLVDEGSNPFEMACACEIFGNERPELGRVLYEFQLCAPTRRIGMRGGLFAMQVTGSLADLSVVDTLVVPNRPDVGSKSRPAVLQAIRAAADRGARLVGMCTGAFTLAEAGLLDGRRATVHWTLAREFQTRFPKVHLEPDVLYVDDGDLLTSAGSAAALDLALHIVRLDHGAEVANHVSRRLVFAAHRDGGQRQFVEQPVPDAADRSLAPVLEWVLKRLSSPLTVSAVARQAAVSTATLHRRFQQEIGTTPWAWITGQRVALALRLLESQGLPVKAVAHRSGLGTPANLRHRIKEHTGLSPSAYAQRFSMSPGA